MGFEDVTNNYLITKLLSGFQKNIKNTNVRYPITLNILKLLIVKVPLLCYNKFESSLFTAAFSLAFHGFFRVGGITFTSAAYQDRVLSINDVSLINNSELINTVRGSKTDQLFKGQRIRIQQTGTHVCPVVSLSEYLKRRPRYDGQLFLHMNGERLTRSEFNAVLKNAVSMLGEGFQNRNYSAHSFRIGAATTASMMGISDDIIKAAGRWASDAYANYIRSDLVIDLPRFT
jgi:hypothetical protein